MAKKEPSKPVAKGRHRDAETGRYVSKAYAEKNPKTTVKESDRRTRGRD